MRTGVYEILNNTSGKRYVGSAVYFSARWGCHKRQLRAGTHHSAPLQRAWNKYGEAAFSFNKILVCRKEDLLLYEQHLIDALKPEYNVAKRAGSTLGVKATPNAKRLLSKSMSERILTNPKKTRGCYRAGQRRVEGCMVRPRQAKADDGSFQEQNSAQVGEALRV